MTNSPGTDTIPNTSTNTSTTYWFKRRRYGWGWTPVTRAGWLVVAAFAAALIIPALVLGDRIEDTGWWLFAWLAWVVICALALFAITARHAPKGKWRWGQKPSDNPNEDI